MKTGLKSSLLITICLMLSIHFTACKDDELPSGGVTVGEGTALVWERICDYHTLHIDTDLPWTVEVEGAWITPLAMKGDGVTDLQVYVEQNDNEGDRQGIIRITPEGYKATEISVRQKGINTSDDNSEREMKNLIGLGYDYTSGYLSPNGIRAQVFNGSKIETIHKTICDTTVFLLTEAYSLESFNSRFGFDYVGSGLCDYMPTQKYFSEDSKTDIEEKNSYILMKKYDINHESTTATHSYFTSNIRIHSENFRTTLEEAPRHRRIPFNSSCTYEDEYVFDLFDKFGTHVITGEFHGGSIIYVMTIDKKIADSDLKRYAALEIGWKHRLNLPMDKLERTLFKEFENHYHDRITVVGGDISILSGLINGGTCTAEELEKWGETIADHPELIRLNLTLLSYCIPHELSDYNSRNYMDLGLLPNGTFDSYYTPRYLKEKALKQ